MTLIIRNQDFFCSGYSTANAFSDDISAAMAAGMDAHVSKPLDIELFCVLIVITLFFRQKIFHDVMICENRINGYHHNIRCNIE